MIFRSLAGYLMAIVCLPLRKKCSFGIFRNDSTLSGPYFTYMNI